MVTDDAAPTHTMSFSVPVPIDPAVAALGPDKQEEEKAVCDLRNISRKEIKKRQKISNYGLALSVIGTAFFIAKDNEISRYFRLSMMLPYSIWLGYLISAQTGI